MGTKRLLIWFLKTLSHKSLLSGQRHKIYLSPLTHPLCQHLLSIEGTGRGGWKNCRLPQLPGIFPWLPIVLAPYAVYKYTHLSESLHWATWHLLPSWFDLQCSTTGPLHLCIVQWTSSFVQVSKGALVFSPLMYPSTWKNANSIIRSSEAIISPIKLCSQHQFGTRSLSYSAVAMIIIFLSLSPLLPATPWL